MPSRVNRSLIVPPGADSVYENRANWFAADSSEWREIETFNVGMNKQTFFKDIERRLCWITVMTLQQPKSKFYRAVRYSPTHSHQMVGSKDLFSLIVCSNMSCQAAADGSAGIATPTNKFATAFSEIEAFGIFSWQFPSNYLERNLFGFKAAFFIGIFQLNS